MTPKTVEYKDFVTAAIKQNVSGLYLTDEDYRQTLADDFIFYANEEECNLEQWIARMKILKSKRKSLSVTFDQVIAEDDTVATVYFVKGINLDNSELIVKIIAFFKVRDGKINYCNELTYVIKGHW